MIIDCLLCQLKIQKGKTMENENEKLGLSDEEPVKLFNGILAIIGLMVTFGVVAITPDQMDAIEKALPYLIGFFGSAFSIGVYVVNRYVVRARVTPVASPKDNDGNKLVPAVKNE